ncbi:CocE/NonD family hydrolase [Aeromicrobium endophyticum]|uniref:CocE/NonD family hydrolase n=1 Tax=Aeromicrobium endophyticum TaxID=2292704 RepID=A0A371NZM0_9ACTN|nr:CocE/NonD family hydrolase [Aeromicrobium endophyticum]REK68848.1 CocE/NonD family hydrolase [Aeromicrobium endophyticum]
MATTTVDPTRRDSYPPDDQIERFASIYIEVRDGTRLAADIYLPPGRPQRLASLLVFTPYYRRMAGPDDGSRLSHQVDKDVKFFCGHGYALVIVDVRGTGASFGTRPAFRSPQERDDYYDVTDWVVAQDWSDGTVGAFGASYSGAAADFLASTQHPAVKAVVPGFAIWDTYTDMFYPGGLLSRTLTDQYGPMVRALDTDDREALSAFPLYEGVPMTGPASVDADIDGALLREAVLGHQANFDMAHYIRQISCRDDAPPFQEELTAEAISPSAYATGTSAAVLAVSGWFDGAGYCDGAVRRAAARAGDATHLLIGPWDHCAYNANVSPFEADASFDFSLDQEYLDFFDHYLRGRANGFGERARVRYYTLGAGEWKSSENFPPSTSHRHELFLTPEAELLPTPPHEGETSYEVDLRATSGSDTRHRLGVLPRVDEYYADWDGRTDVMHRFSTPPLRSAVTITGYPELTLTMRTSTRDAALFVYLEDVDPDGRARYVTEGTLRLAFAGSSYVDTDGNVRRDFRRADLCPVPDEGVNFSLTLSPTSWKVGAGHRLRLAISGCDVDNFAHVPVGQVPRFSFLHGQRTPSMLRLPSCDAEGVLPIAARGME